VRTHGRPARGTRIYPPFGAFSPPALRSWDPTGFLPSPLCFVVYHGTDTTCCHCTQAARETRGMPLTLSPPPPRAKPEGPTSVPPFHGVTCTTPDHHGTTGPPNHLVGVVHEGVEGREVAVERDKVVLPSLHAHVARVVVERGRVDPVQLCRARRAARALHRAAHLIEARRDRPTR
jgi:hypothetical protein